MKTAFAMLLGVLVTVSLVVAIADARAPEVRASRQNFEDVRAPRVFGDTWTARQNFEDVRAPRQNFEDVRAPRADR